MMRRSDHLSPIAGLPTSSDPIASKATICHIGDRSLLATTWQSQTGISTHGEQGFCQGHIMGTGWSKPKAGNDSLWGDGRQQMEATIATDATAPALVRCSGQPAPSSPFDVAHCPSRRVKDLIEARGFWQRIRQRDAHLGNDAGEVLLLTGELAPIGQARKGPVQSSLGIAIKISLAGKLSPLPKEGQGDHFATAQPGVWARMLGILQPTGLAQIIDHDVQCGQKGFHIDHE
jgi:hypothetical protein